MLFRKATFGAATVGAVLGLSGLVHADEPATKDQPVRVNEKGDKVKVKTVQAGDRSTKGQARRVTVLDGLSVYNKKSEKLGSLSDVVIDLSSGEVKYAALSRGGLAGIGDKLFAIPWNAMKHGEFVKDGKKYEFLRLDVQPETLENAPGFDQNKWPDFASARYTNSVDTHFRTKDHTDKEDRADTEENDVDESIASKSQDHIHRSSKITGMVVENATRKKLGSVKDLVIDVDTGKIRYAVLSFGGIAGFGDKMFAVPWKAMKCEYSGEDESHYLVLNVKYEKLKQASGFDNDNWPDFGNATFLSDNDKQYHEDATDDK